MRTWLIAFFVVFSSSALYLSDAAEENADILIQNVRLAPGGEEELSVAIAGSRILKVGKNLDGLCGSDCRRISGKGKFLAPGFHDAHAHPINGGAQFFQVNVSGSDPASIASAVRAYAAQHPEQEWIFGRGWNAAGFSPHRSMLDAAEPNRPVVLEDSDGHSIWVNSAALRAAEITRDTPDPEGGTIVRDANGEPTGVFLENAYTLIYEHAPETTIETRKQYILKSQEVGTPAGITAFQGGPSGLKTAEAYKELEKEGKLHIRAFLWADLEAKDKEFNKWLEFARQQEGSMVRLSAFKGFVDGVFSVHTAALKAPYADRPGESGEPIVEQGKLNELVLRANRHGFPVALHATGDKAVRMSLDAFAYSKAKIGHNLLNRVEHVESLDPADAARFASTGTAASMQPTHMAFGSPSSSYYLERLGRERVKHTFAWNELHQAGVMLLFGTDYPVVSWDPVDSLFTAVHRKHGNGQVSEPQQRVSREVAFRAWTENPANAVGMADRLGKVREGYLADLALWPQNPALSQNRSLSPALVLVNGKIVWER